jgi:hypothetical protein
VQAMLPRPLDRRGDECRAHAAPAPLTRDRHADLAEPERGLLDTQPADGFVAGDRDQGPVERPAGSARVHVHRRFRADSVTLLRNGGEQNRERESILVPHRTDLEPRIHETQSRRLQSQVSRALGCANGVAEREPEERPDRHVGDRIGDGSEEDSAPTDRLTSH